jgi:hypothetical protein
MKICQDYASLAFPFLRTGSGEVRLVKELFDGDYSKGPTQLLVRLCQVCKHSVTIERISAVTDVMKAVLINEHA